MVETLVALAIAAIAMVALFRAVTQSTSASVSVERHIEAGALARSLLLDAGQLSIDKPFERSGRSGDLTWKLTAELTGGATGRLAPRGMGLYDVRATVNWAPRGQFELNTLVLGK